MAEKKTKEERFTDALAAWFVGDGPTTPEALHHRNLSKVTTYFGAEGKPYDGSHFETYGFRDEDAYRIVPADLVAVATLSMEVAFRTKSGISTANAIDIERRAHEITALLRQIPPSKEIHDLSPEECERYLEKGSVGDQLWHLLRDPVDEGGIGMYAVATFKLMARKRPHLFPIADSRTRKVLGNPKNWWTSWHHALVDRKEIVDELKRLRTEAAANDLPNVSAISLLRIADIALWME